MERLKYFVGGRFKESETDKYYDLIIQAQVKSWPRLLTVQKKKWKRQ